MRWPMIGPMRRADTVERQYLRGAGFTRPTRATAEARTQGMGLEPYQPLKKLQPPRGGSLRKDLKYEYKAPTS